MVTKKKKMKIRRKKKDTYLHVYLKNENKKNKKKTPICMMDGSGVTWVGPGICMRLDLNISPFFL